MIKKYFLYTRVSNDDYDKSIDNQKDILEKIADDKKLRHNLVKPYYEEHKSWSRDTDRPLFDDMINKLEIDMKKAGNDVDKREYGWVLFFKIDRLARNDSDFERLLRLLDAWYEFISATETIENTPTGRLLFRMLSSFAVYESEKLSNRQSIAKIHNLIIQKFDSLWWDMVIFGYELKNAKIQKNKKEAEIISRIYDLYIENYSKVTYKDIFDCLDKEYEWFLTKYLKNKWKTTPERFIRNIITNKTAFKYNWYIEINISVNDELIKNYIETVTAKKYDKYGFTIEWDCKIWGKVKFVYFLNELIIIPDTIYEQKESILKEWKLKSKDLVENKTLFEDILYLSYNNNLYPFKWKPEQKKGKYNNYRRNVAGRTFRVSEKKIDDKIVASKKVQNILDKLTPCLPEIKNILLTINKPNIDTDIKKIRAVINLYWWSLDRYDWLIKNSSDNIESNIKLFKRYSILLKEANHKLFLLEQRWISQINEYLQILWISDLSKQSSHIKRLTYICLFDKIAYEQLGSNDFKIILYPFTFLSELLWIQKEIAI